MTTLLTGGRQVTFAGHTIQINSDQALMHQALDAHFKYCFGAQGPVIAEYKITTFDDGNFRLSVNGGDLLSKVNRERILSCLMQDLNARLNGESTSQLVFHAAALAQGERGIILCGKSGSGKSSLTAWLLANGLQYLTDEVIAFPINNGEITGLCRSLVLKSGSSFIWQRWLADKTDSAGFLQFKDGSAWISPTLFHADAFRASVVPRLLIFPHYVADAEFYVKQLTAAETVFQLLQTLVNARNFPDHGMAVTTRLARHVSAFSMIYSDVEGAAQWIQERISA